MNKNAFIIIAKRPEKGKVKTRIQGLTDEERVVLYEKLLKHTVSKLGNISHVDTFIAFAPETARDYFLQFNLKLIPLHQGDLGIRMFEAFKEVFTLGYKKASLSGADIPDLSQGIILKSFDVLDKHDLVYGPATDGGYYLVGMRKLIREVFENVPWSSDQTLTKSIKQAKNSHHTVGLIDTLSDIDTIEDVKESGILNSSGDKQSRYL